MSALTASTNLSNQDGKIIEKERIYELLCKYVRSHGSKWSRDQMKKWYHFVHDLYLHSVDCYRIQIRQGISHLIPLCGSEELSDPFPIFFQDSLLIQVRVLLLLAWRKQAGRRTRKRARVVGISLPSNVIYYIFSFLLPINFTLC